MPFEGYFIDAGTPDAWNDAVKASIEHGRYNTGLVRLQTVLVAAQDARAGVSPQAQVDTAWYQRLCDWTIHRVHVDPAQGAHVGDNARLVA